MRRVRPLSSHKKVVEETAPAQEMTLAEAELHLTEAANLQASQLRGNCLYWGETENCLARLSDAVRDNQLLGAAARAYSAYCKRQRELRKDLLRIALQLARGDSELQKRDKTDRKNRDRSSEDGVALNGSLLLLFGTLNASDGSRCCHRVAVNAVSAALTRDTLNLSPLQLPLQSGEPDSRRRTQKLQREVKNQKATPGGEGLSASYDSVQLKETENSIARSPDSSNEPQSLSTRGRTHTGNTCLEGLGMSSCPSAEHMDAATEGFKLGVVRIVEAESVLAEHPLVSQLTSVLTAYRVGFSEAGQPDLASTKTATASTDGSAGDSGSDDKRCQPRKQQQSRSRTVAVRQEAAAAAAATSTTGHRTNRQRRSSEKPPRTEKALKSSPSTTQPNNKRLVFLTLEYQKDSKSATWRCPSSAASRPASESKAANGGKRKQTEEKAADCSSQSTRRRKPSSNAGSVGNAEEELAGVDAAVSSKQSRTRKSENRKSITQALQHPQEATLTAASNSSVGKSGSSGKQKTATVRSRKPGSSWT